ncbi:hypothetical protein JCM16303_003964 [Sporobolomyces ruberrimus]
MSGLSPPKSDASNQPESEDWTFIEALLKEIVTARVAIRIANHVARLRQFLRFVWDGLGQKSQIQIERILEEALEKINTECHYVSEIVDTIVSPSASPPHFAVLKDEVLQAIYPKASHSTAYKKMVQELQASRKFYLEWDERGASEQFKNIKRLCELLKFVKRPTRQQGYTRENPKILTPEELLSGSTHERTKTPAQRGAENRRRRKELERLRAEEEQRRRQQPSELAASAALDSPSRFQAQSRDHLLNQHLPPHVFSASPPGSSDLEGQHPTFSPQNLHGDSQYIPKDPPYPLFLTDVRRAASPVLQPRPVRSRLNTLRQRQGPNYQDQAQSPPASNLDPRLFD